VCNEDGRIGQCNERAAQLLEGAAPGASVYEWVDQSRALHALDKVGRRLEQEVAHPVAQWVATRGERLLRVLLAPVLDPRNEPAGFVLLVEDVTRVVESDSRRERLLRDLTEGTRASLASIRAAAEMVHQYPDMDGEQRRRFGEVIHDEAGRMSARLDAALAAAGQSLRGSWPLEDMPVTDLADALQRNIERSLGVPAGRGDSTDGADVSVDSHALVHALTALAARLVSRLYVRSMMLETMAAGRFVRLALCWNGAPLAPEVLSDWQAQPLADAGQGGAATLDQLLQRHGAEMWSQADRVRSVNRVFLQLPVALTAELRPTVPGG
jgi:DNA polymerase-3 subunit epsilon